jgi:hypothetical protein
MGGPELHYSPLEQINAGNFNKLQVAWRLKTDFGPRPETNLQSTPLMVKGVLYSWYAQGRGRVEQARASSWTQRGRRRQGMTPAALGAAWRTGPMAAKNASFT